MKTGVSYITMTDGMVHFLMRPTKQSSLLQFSSPAPSEVEAVEAVMRYAADQSIALDRSVVSVDGRTCMLKNYRFPLQNKRQINRVIDFELEEDIPLELSDIVSDSFQGDRRGRESSICVAARKGESVRSLLSMFDEQGVVVESLDVDVAAFARSCSTLFPEQERSVGLDIGQHRILLCYLAHGKVQRLAVIPWGEVALVECVAQAGKVKPDEVERLMVFGDAEEDKGSEYNLIREQVAIFLRKVLREINRQLGDGPMPGHFILSGDIVRVQCVRELFPSLSKGRLDIWEEVFFGPGEDVDEGARGIGLATAYGTALKGGPAFDLRKGEFALQKAASGWRRYAWPMVASMVLVCLAWAGYGYATLLAVERNLAALRLATRQVYAETLPDVKRNLVPAQLESVLASRLDALSGARLNGQQWQQPVIEVLRQASASLGRDTDIEFLSLFLTTKRVDIHGGARSMADVESVRRALSKTGAFTEVKIKSAVADKNAGGVRFEVEMSR